MKIVHFHLHPYRLPMVAPIELTHHTFSIKEGWFLTARTDTGISAQAEIPSLPGVHPVKHHEVPYFLEPILSTIKNCPFDTHPFWNRPLFNLLPYSSIPIQFLFALESLLLKFYRLKFLQQFSLSPTLSVPLNELFIPNTFETHTPVASTLKVKLPGLSSPSSTLRALLAQNKNCRLRLDPNRTLTPDNLKSLVACLPPENLEYIEDPYPDLSEGLKQFDRFPLALDKELAHALKSARFPTNTTALVIKPSRDLAISGTLDLILEKKYKVVISSAYETPVGLWPLIHLAAVSRTPCGLDVQKLFKPSPSICFHPVARGTIRLGPNYQKQSIAMHHKQQTVRRKELRHICLIL